MKRKKTTIIGISGKMGQALLACASATPQIDVIGGIHRKSGFDHQKDLIAASDVVIDFSFHSVTPIIADLCAMHKKAMIIGTTSHSDDEKSAIIAHGSTIPIVMTSNFSIGITLLNQFARSAAEILGEDVDVEIVETHHRFKKDAPSGTATMLAQTIAKVRGQLLKEVAKHGRSGIVGPRDASEIGIHSIRGGDVIGDHTIIYAGLGERLELTHKASSRNIFASGALRAAQWIIGKDPGLYTMEHVLGLVKT
jgi:4-hydroxy-tetrahydrodipicolinate reductase